MSEQPSLLTPSDGPHNLLTPSALTPNTRTEAEAALTLNSINQTDAAGPDPALLEDGTSEAQKAYRRPGVPRTSSFNYQDALRRAQQASVSSNMSADSEASGNTAEETVASPASSATPFPPPGQGVVPLNYGAVGASRSDSVKKTRSRGLSLSGLAQQQGWSEQDYKRVYTSDLVAKPKESAGYRSEAAPKSNEP
ncbi:hypothetical protein IAQ61_000526 [Plenodomus lingam]|uniref:uncharacterized protein n=1 Tax=Leptosphaeria maculans TaxID=5022 RepID=UPI0033191E2D|nr:hypothetical protein IAQ61_000526 [Plenodomus lingam]